MSGCNRTLLALFSACVSEAAASSSYRALACFFVSRGASEDDISAGSGSRSRSGSGIEPGPRRYMRLVYVTLRGSPTLYTLEKASFRNLPSPSLGLCSVDEPGSLTNLKGAMHGLACPLAAREPFISGETDGSIRAVSEITCLLFGQSPAPHERVFPPPPPEISGKFPGWAVWW